MSELLKRRRKLAAVRLQILAHAPQEIVKFLRSKPAGDPSGCYTQNSAAGPGLFFKLAGRISAAEATRSCSTRRPPDAAPAGL